MLRNFFVIAIVLLLTVLLVSCGSDGGSSTSPPAQVSITSPTVGATVGKTITISGTTTGDVTLVQVKYGTSAFIQATGTNTWSIDLDTTTIPDGETTITVQAICQNWDKAETFMKLTINNIDPIIGTWDWQSGTGYSQSWGYGYINFLPSGAYDESNGTIFTSWAYSWRRESDSVISINRSTAGPLTVHTTFSEDKNTLNLQWSTSTSSFSVNYHRRLN